MKTIEVLDKLKEMDRLVNNLPLKVREKYFNPIASKFIEIQELIDNDQIFLEVLKYHDQIDEIQEYECLKTHFKEL